MLAYPVCNSLLAFCCNMISHVPFILHHFFLKYSPYFKQMHTRVAWTGMQGLASVVSTREKVYRDAERKLGARGSECTVMPSGSRGVEVKVGRMRSLFPRLWLASMSGWWLLLTLGRVDWGVGVSIPFPASAGRILLGSWWQGAPLRPTEGEEATVEAGFIMEVKVSLRCLWIPRMELDKQVWI